jgi:sn-glycerol 3-phosphate transport system ATP-binding protein
MRFEIQKLHRRLGTTSLYVTHDQVEAMTLAQRMVVMNAGRAEQIGTPMEVYQNPATVFVAGFIGSPAMNFIAGKSEGNGRIGLDGGGSVVVPNAPVAGRKLTIGIRPEHLTPRNPSEANLVGSVEMIEALGADTLIHVAVAGRTIIARLPNGTPAEVGEPIALAADRDRIYLFDAESGARLRT